MPKSDVMDLYAADFANLILNNSLNDALLEFSFGGCILQSLENTTICISGADFSPALNQMNVTLHTKVEAQKNDILSSGKRSFDACSYLVVKGGFQTEVKLQSRSFFQHITQQYDLKKGDLLPILSLDEEISKSNAYLKFSDYYFTSKEIYCDKGPEFDLVDDFQKKNGI